MDNDGPIWSNDCPDGEDANLAVREDASLDDWLWRVVSFEFSSGVDRLASDCDHSADV